MPTLTSILSSCEAVPMVWHEPLYVPILFTVLGIALFSAGKVAETREMKTLTWKWWAGVPLAIALYSGLTTANCMRDNFYWSAMMDFGAKKQMLGHFGAIGLPVLAIAGLGIWHWLSTRDPFRV